MVLFIAPSEKVIKFLKLPRQLKNFKQFTELREIDWNNQGFFNPYSTGHWTALLNKLSSYNFTIYSFNAVHHLFMYSSVAIRLVIVFINIIKHQISYSNENQYASFSSN